MINQTNHNSFEPFGSIYTEPVDIAKLNLTRREITSSSPKITDLFVFPCEVCIECPPGLSRLLIASSPDMDDVKTFAVRNNLRLKPNTYFNLIPLSTPLVWYIITPREIPGQSADLSVHISAGVRAFPCAPDSGLLVYQSGRTLPSHKNVP